jgi:hypothetical protein
MMICINNRRAPIDGERPDEVLREERNHHQEQ